MNVWTVSRYYPEHDESDFIGVALSIESAKALAQTGEPPIVWREFNDGAFESQVIFESYVYSIQEYDAQ